MPAARAAASRLIPSKALASANRRLLTRPSRSRRASARSSAGVRLVAIGTATMAQAPGLLSLPGQLAGRRPRSRLPVAGIIAVRKDVLDIVRHHILRLGRDGRVCPKIGVAGAVAEDREAFLKVVVAEHVLEGSVHGGLVRDFGVVRAPLIHNLERYAVLDGLAHCIFVDIVAKHPLSLVNRRSRVGDTSGVPNALVKIGA